MRLDTRSVRYAGHEAVVLDAGDLRAFVATGFGPRVIGLEVDDSGNLFAETPEAWLPAGPGERFRFRGGHRLWAAPERAEFTYRPDDDPVEVRSTDGGLLIVGPVDRVTGLRRAIELRGVGDGLEVRHVVRNEGPDSVRFAPWAITMFPIGGRAWLPLRPAGTWDDVPIPDRVLVLWPYTDVRDPRLALGDAVVEIEAAPRPGRDRIKLGASGSAGVLAYLRDGWLFEKQASVVDAAYADLGAAAQVYADERFLELETLGPLASVAPGEEVEHLERWSVSRGAEVDVRERLGS